MEIPPSPDRDRCEDDRNRDPRPVVRHLKRRTLVGVGALAAAAAGAHIWFRRHGSPDVAQQLRLLDAWWRGESSQVPIPNSAEVAEYKNYLGADPLRYLRPDEILRPHFKKRSGTICGLPPREIWSRLRPSLRVADELRHRLGVPLRAVLSAYRSPAYNAKCPGASRYSQHMQNRALDLVFDCPPEEAFAMASRLREEGFFTGGLGLYDSFIHIDTRGWNATWGV